MMPSLNNTHMAWTPQMSTTDYSTGPMLHDLSLQLAASNPTRLSRGSSNSQRPVNAMRVTKPRSANNSPRATISQCRRRTLIGESLQNLQGRQQQHQHQHQQKQAVDLTYLPTPASEIPSEPFYCEPEKRSARPVSWHPSSYHAGQAPIYHQQQTMFYPYSTCGEAEVFPSLQPYPSTPAVYSGYNTPSSSFSPLSLPYSHFDSEQYFPSTTQPAAPQQAPVFQPICNSQQVSPAPTTRLPQVFDRCSAPPTPEDFNQCQQPETKLAAEEAIPFQPLDDDESEGEILYGMGLYDSPDKSYNDPPLDLHRSTLMSLLGGAGSYPEPTGKGLKLEDAWEPPVSDDEDEGESEQDAEGEDQDE